MLEVIRVLLTEVHKSRTTSCVGWALHTRTSPSPGGSNGSGELVIRLDLIHKDRAVFTSMTLSVNLAITIDVEQSHETPPFDGLLPDCGTDDSTLPRDVLRHTRIE
jgi:hypothetical protein